MLGWLKEPSLNGLRSGSPEFFTAQKRLLLSRPLLKRNYDDWYRLQLEDIRSAPAGAILELGSGGSYLKDLAPEIVTSDVVEGVAEKVVDARTLPFGDETIRALLAIHVFHHIPDVEAFFNEARRTLVKGGVVSMIEISHTPFARFFFSHFHHEPYDDTQTGWRFNQRDAMMESNQALSWIVFGRDRARFEQRFPELKIEHVELLPWFTYFASGGVTMKNIIPKFLNAPLIGCEYVLRPLAGALSLYWHIRLRKT